MRGTQVKSIARKAAIIDAAVRIASERGGWAKMTREAIALEAGCSQALVSHYLGDIPKIRKAVIKIAVQEEIRVILIQSLNLHDGYVVKRWLPASLKHLL